MTFVQIMVLVVVVCMSAVQAVSILAKAAVMKRRVGVPNGKWMMADYFVIDGEGRKMPEYKAVEVDIPIIAWMPLPEPWRGEET